MRTNPRATYTVDTYLYRVGWSCVKISVQFYRTLRSWNRLECNIIFCSYSTYFRSDRCVSFLVSVSRNVHSFFILLFSPSRIRLFPSRYFSGSVSTFISVCYFCTIFERYYSPKLFGVTSYSRDLFFCYTRLCIFQRVKSGLRFAARDCFRFLFRKSGLARTRSSCIL